MEDGERCAYVHGGSQVPRSVLVARVPPVTAPESLTDTGPFTGRRGSANWPLRLSIAGAGWAEAPCRTAS